MIKLDKYQKEEMVRLKANIKSFCQWCGFRLPGTLEYYMGHGNACATCSVRAEKVAKGLITEEESDKRLSKCIKEIKDGLL